MLLDSEIKEIKSRAESKLGKVVHGAQSDHEGNERMIELCKLALLGNWVRQRVSIINYSLYRVARTVEIDADVREDAAEAYNKFPRGYT